MRLARRWLLLALLSTRLRRSRRLEAPTLRDVVPLQPYLLGIAVLMFTSGGSRSSETSESCELRRSANALQACRERGVGCPWPKHVSDKAAAQAATTSSRLWSREPDVAEAPAVARNVTASLLLHPPGTRNLIFERAPLPITSGDDDSEVPEVDTHRAALRP